ncbi:MAG: hypothetical protein ACF8XB_03165 [Planctomycetota bacterium JB042]
MRSTPLPSALVAVAALLFAPEASAQGPFVNFETPHVHPLDVTPDGTRLLAVNTPDGRLEVLDLTGPVPRLEASIPVGVDPVSVRARNDGEAWVVNHLSDSVSVVDLASGRVVATLDTDDEPADVAFAGTTERAFVTCSQANRILVFDPTQLQSPPIALDLPVEEPRALAVSADGKAVYAAVFESGNGTTILGGGSDDPTIISYPPNVVGNVSGPYAGANPPPNSGAQFSPPQKAGNPIPPKVGLIVRKSPAGTWLDDNGGDWTGFVTGPQALLSGRRVGWDLPDRDVVVLDADSLAASYATGLMNVVMGLAVHPTSGEVTVVGTDATNEVRFEPNLNGVFVRVLFANVDPSGPTTQGIADLNPHLDYSVPNLPQGERDKSIGDPRGLVWNAAGTKGYVVGMGSNNVVIVDAAGARAGATPTIEVGEGPTGVVLDEARARLYVLNKFASTISVVSTAFEVEVATVPLHDASPAAIKVGRKHLYDTHLTSGLGQASCASCHVDARIDRLAWDLGDPGGDVKSLAGQNLGANVPGLNTGFQPFHPMKGPMTTQTLQDIVGKEPHHWRGDRDGLEEFAGAFSGLLGDDQPLPPAEMQEFEDFLATIHFPPNPFREFDNSLPTNLPLPGHYTTGRFGLANQPLPNGNAVAGLALYRPPNLIDQGNFACITCHTLPLGMSTGATLAGFQYQPIPAGPNGEQHHALLSVDGLTNKAFKVPQMRNLYEKVGFDAKRIESRAGFGFLHDGTVDSLARFVNLQAFNVSSDQQTADLVAFLLALSGSDLPGSTGTLLEPPGTASLDAHAAVGTQTTVVDAQTASATQLQLVTDMLALADQGEVGVVVKGIQGGVERGYAYQGGGAFQADRQAETPTAAALLAAAAPGSELTYTVVPAGTETRVGVDRDEDGALDRDELDAGSDPADAASTPGCGVIQSYGAGCAGAGGFVPVLELTGCAAGGGALSLSLQQANGGGTALLLLGVGPTTVPLADGCSLHVAPLLGAGISLPLGGALPGTGSVAFTTVLPPAIPPGTLTLQAAVADPTTSLGFTTTNGVSLAFP